VTLPAGMDAAHLLTAAEAAGMSFLPGTNFHLDGRGQSTLRLAFSLFTPKEMAEGGRRLARVVTAALA
jgi:2-aminoadipate transaminase